MTGKADDHKEINKPPESQPSPEVVPKSGVIGDASKHAEWRATQQERMRAQEHSATDLLHDKNESPPRKTKFELVDDASSKRKELLARSKEQENTGSLIADEAKKNPTAEPVNKLKQWADKLPDGPDKERFENLVRQEAAALSPKLAARMKEHGISAPDDTAKGNAGDQTDSERQNKREAHENVPAGHSPGWMEVGRKLADLPVQTQAQIIGNGLLAGLKQYNNEQREREWGALIGTVQGIGDTAINLAKIADFCAYCIIGDTERAGKMGEEFGTSLGQSVISGVNIFEAAKAYGENIENSGDIGKPIRDVIAVGQILDCQWEKLPPREQERQKYELISQLVSDQLIGSHGAKAIGKAADFTEMLGAVSKAAAEHGGHSLNEIKKAAAKISDLTKDLLSPEYVLPGVGKIKASQLAKGEQNIAKMLGRTGEYEPEKKSLFLKIDERKLLKDKDIDLHGGLKKLESMTAEELEKEGLRRFEMPKLNLWWSDRTFSASIPGTFSMLNGTMLERGVVDVINIRKGLLPEGAGAHFLAEALRAHNAIPTKELWVSLISNVETLEAFAKNVPAEQSLLGRHSIKALKELGLKAESAQWIKEGKTVNIVFKIKR